MESKSNNTDAMDFSTGFRLGKDRVVYSSDHRIERPGYTAHLRPKDMAVLRYLVESAGEIVERDKIFMEVWNGQAVTIHVLTQIISELRHHLGDDSHNPQYIQTLPTIGYKLIAPVAAVHSTGNDTGGSEKTIADIEVNKPPSIIENLKQRKVLRVTWIYLAVGWMLAQIAALVFPVFRMPDWTVAMTVVLIALGFPIALVMAYAFEITSTGSIKRDRMGSQGKAGTTSARRIEISIISLLSVVVVSVSIYLLSRIKDDIGPPTSAVVVQAPTMSIAVLPFDNLSSNPNDSYFGEGLTEDIRLHLSRIADLIVAPRIHTQDALNTTGLSQLGSRLGVAMLLEGTVRKVDDNVRVTARLIQVSDRKELWSSDYNRELSNILNLQRDVSQAIADALEILLGPTKSGPNYSSLMRSTNSPEAYALYLQGLDLIGRSRDSVSLKQASEVFLQAIAIDSQFASAYAALCQTYLTLFESTGNTEIISDAQSSCGTALLLDDESAGVHAALGRLFLLQGKFELAKRSLQTAIKIEPGLAEAYGSLGDVFLVLDDRQNAEKSYLKALRLRPNWGAYNDLGRFMFKIGRYDEAIAYYLRVITLNPNDANGHSNLGVTYFLIGDFESAAQAYQKSLGINPGSAAYSNTGLMFYYSGNFNEALKMFEQAIELAPKDYRLWGNRADTLRYVAKANDSIVRTTYEKAIELVLMQLNVNENDAAAWANLSWYYVNVGQDKLSDDSLKRAGILAPGDPEIMYTTALVFLKLHNEEFALDALAEAKARGFPVNVITATPDFVSIKDNKKYRELIRQEIGSD